VEDIIIGRLAVVSEIESVQLQFDDAMLISSWLSFFVDTLYNILPDADCVIKIY